MVCNISSRSTPSLQLILPSSVLSRARPYWHCWLLFWMRTRNSPTQGCLTLATSWTRVATLRRVTTSCLSQQVRKINFLRYWRGQDVFGGSAGTYMVPILGPVNCSLYMITSTTPKAQVLCHPPPPPPSSSLHIPIIGTLERGPSSSKVRKLENRLTKFCLDWAT